MRKFYIIGAVVLSIVVIYYVVTNIGKYQRQKEEAAKALGGSEGTMSKGEKWGKLAGTFLDPGGFISGSGFL